MGPGRSVELPDDGVATEALRGQTMQLVGDIEPVTGTTFRLTIDEVAEANSTDWFGGTTTVLPVGIAELGLRTVEGPSGDDAIPSECRDDLVTIDGAPVPLRAEGTVEAATSGDGLDLVACGAPTVVPAGRSLLESGDGEETGLDVDTLALSSAPGGGAGLDTLAEPAEPGPPPPTTSTERTGRNRHRVQVEGADEPYWVVLGQSWSPGFEATTSDGRSLGEPTLINGYANGWLVDPQEFGLGPDRGHRVGPATGGLGRHRCVGPGRARLPGPDPVAARTSSTQGPCRRCRRMTPRAVVPWHQDGPVLGWVPALAATATAAVLATLFGSPVLGAATALLTLVAARVPRGQIGVARGEPRSVRRGGRVHRRQAVPQRLRGRLQLGQPVRDRARLDAARGVHPGGLGRRRRPAPPAGAIRPRGEPRRQRRGRSATASSTSVDGSMSSVMKNCSSVMPDWPPTCSVLV